MKIKCRSCGATILSPRKRFCGACRVARRKKQNARYNESHKKERSISNRNRYKNMTHEQAAKKKEHSRRWARDNPEKMKEIRARSREKKEKHIPYYRR